MCVKDADGMENIVDSEILKEQSDQSLLCFLRPICPNIKNSCITDKRFSGLIRENPQLMMSLLIVISHQRNRR